MFSIIILGIIFIAILIIIFVRYFDDLNNTNADNTNINNNSSGLSNVNGELFNEQGQSIDFYYQVYENPYVIHIRTALDGYLDGTNEGISVSEVAVNSWENEGSPAGLDSFDKDYYKSKFIVLTINDNIAGGQIVDIIFQDKPDKVFTAWVYQTGDTYDFRGFWQNMNYTDEVMQEVNEEFKIFLEDREHSL
jgi:hypothetical protein